MKNIRTILEKGNPRKYTGVSRSGVNHEFQATALRIIEKLNIPRPRYSSYFAAVKREDPSIISRAFSFAIDHPNILARDKMFFWKLNDLKRNTGA